MSIDEKMLADLAIVNLNFKTVCDLFGLTEEERLHPNAGAWIVDCINQFKASQEILIKSLKLRFNENTNIQNYNAPPTLPTNPLLAPDDKPVV